MRARNVQQFVTKFCRSVQAALRTISVYLKDEKNWRGIKLWNSSFRCKL